MLEFDKLKTPKEAIEGVWVDLDLPVEGKVKLAAPGNPEQQKFMQKKAIKYKKNKREFDKHIDDIIKEAFAYTVLLDWSGPLFTDKKTGKVPEYNPKDAYELFKNEEYGFFYTLLTEKASVLGENVFDYEEEAEKN